MLYRVNVRFPHVASKLADLGLGSQECAPKALHICHPPIGCLMGVGRRQWQVRPAFNASRGLASVLHNHAYLLIMQEAGLQGLQELVLMMHNHFLICSASCERTFLLTTSAYQYPKDTTQENFTWATTLTGSQSSSQLKFLCLDVVQHDLALCTVNLALRRTWFHLVY